MVEICYYICMDYEEKKRRQMIRVIIAEVGMVLSVIAIVVVAIMLAMGFFISGNGQIEQSGLMQIHSLPTGATVELDGSTLFSRTNLSRTMPAGTHHLKLSRDGYDSWENDVKMYSGVLVRLYYPRLFLQDRTVELAKDLGKEKELMSLDDLEFYQSSPERNYILYAQKGSSNWKMLDLRGDEVKETTFDLSGVLPGMIADEKDDQEKEDGETAAEAKDAKTTQQGVNETVKYHFEGKIEEVKWSANEEKVLVRVAFEDKKEWVLVNLRNIAESLNLTRTLGMTFERIDIIDGAAAQLFGLENHHLRSINVSSKSTSRVLLDQVADYAYNEGNVLYVTETIEKMGRKMREIGVYKNGEEDGTVIDEVFNDAKVRLALARYYDEDYVCYVVGKKLKVRYGSLPSYRREGGTVELKDLVERELEVVPQEFSLSSGNEYLVARAERKFMVTDLDMGEYYEYEAATAELKWLDASMMYAVQDGQITVWDFDGTNKRNLAESRKDDEDTKALNSVVMISPNNRWLYYLATDEDGLSLMREKIRE